MPAFDAAGLADSLEWDFGPFGVKKKGVIPEPSDRQIGDFLDGLKSLFEASRDLLPEQLAGDATPEAMLEAMSQVTGDKFVTMMADIAGLFAQLCSSKPDKDTLLEIPLRYRVTFYGWVQGEVFTPEGGTGVGTVVEMRPGSAAAG